MMSPAPAPAIVCADMLTCHETVALRPQTSKRPERHDRGRDERVPSGGLLALFYVDVGAILAAVMLYWLAGMLGIGMGYHRLLTHRGYKTYKPMEYSCTWCGTLALEGGPIFWVATHRVHHRHSDREGDPHTPREGTWWAHAGWILSGEGLHHDASVLARYVPDLVRDPMQVWLSKWHWTSNVLVGLVLLFAGGVPYVLWGIFLGSRLGCTRRGW